MPDVQGAPAEARVAGGDRGRPQHLGGVRALGERRHRVLRPAFAHRTRAAHRARDPQGDPRAAAVHDRRGAGVPHRGAGGEHAVRRRVAADPARDPDRVEADGRSLHPRRAFDRSPPARQPQADQHAAPAARPRQHAHRGRARRGDDPVGRLHGRHRAGRRRARRRDHRRGSGRGRAQGSELHHRGVPARRPRDSDAIGATQGQRQEARDPRRSRQQFERHRRGDSAGHVRGGFRRERVGQVVAGDRHPQPEGRAAFLQGEGQSRAASSDRRARVSGQGDRHRPVADRAHAAFQPGDLHRDVHVHARPVREPARGKDARLQAGSVQLQREGRAL